MTFFNQENLDLIAVIISSLALALSIFQFIRNSSRKKKEATLDAYNRLQNDAFSVLNDKYPQSSLIPPPDYRSDAWNEITECLVKIELFSTGINTGIYSIWILNRLGGAYFIHQYDRLKVIIEKKRKMDRSRGRHYDEFEQTVEMLKLIRQQPDR